MIRRPAHICPACGADLLILELEAIEIDHCPVCGGSWLDQGELETLAVRAGVREAGPFERLLQRAAQAPPGPRRCLRCRSRLRRVTHGEGAAHIEIDACPDGHGLWFDRDEIRKLVAAASPGAPSAAAAVARFFADALGAGE